MTSKTKESKFSPQENTTSVLKDDVMSSYCNQLCAMSAEGRIARGACAKQPHRSVSCSGDGKMCLCLWWDKIVTGGKHHFAPRVNCVLSHSSVKTVDLHLSLHSHFSSLLHNFLTEAQNVVINFESYCSNKQF